MQIQFIFYVESVASLTLEERNVGKKSLNGKMETFNLVLTLENACSAEIEVKTLKEFTRTLNSNNERINSSLDSSDRDLDTEWLKNAAEGNINPFPDKTPHDVLTEQQYLNRFTFYLFDRRYGWSEHSIHVDPTNTVVKEGPSHSNLGRASSLEIEGKFKAQINELLDDLLKW